MCEHKNIYTHAFVGSDGVKQEGMLDWCAACGSTRARGGPWEVPSEARSSTMTLAACPEANIRRVVMHHVGAGRS